MVDNFVPKTPRLPLVSDTPRSNRLSPKTSHRVQTAQVYAVSPRLTTPRRVQSAQVYSVSPRLPSATPRRLQSAQVYATSTGLPPSSSQAASCASGSGPSSCCPKELKAALEEHWEKHLTSTGFFTGRLEFHDCATLAPPVEFLLNLRAPSTGSKMNDDVPEGKLDSSAGGSFGRSKMNHDKGDLTAKLSTDAYVGRLAKEIPKQRLPSLKRSASVDKKRQITKARSSIEGKLSTSDGFHAIAHCHGGGLADAQRVSDKLEGSKHVGLGFPPACKNKSGARTARRQPDHALPHTSVTHGHLNNSLHAPQREAQTVTEQENRCATSRQHSKQDIAARTSEKSEVISPTNSRTGRQHSKQDLAARTQEKPEGISPTNSRTASSNQPFALPVPGMQLLKRRSSKGDRAFEISLSVAREHNLPVDDVRSMWQDFTDFDTNGNGALSPLEFVSAIRKACNIPPNEPVPEHLQHHHWSSVDADGSGEVTFDEYVLWCNEVAFSEEVLVPDAGEREMRRVAREHGFLLIDVEKIKHVFDAYDNDKSGHIDEDEFRGALLSLMKVQNAADVSDKKLKRYWREVDRDRSGTIDFEEFLLWYNTSFCAEIA